MSVKNAELKNKYLSHGMVNPFANEPTIVGHSTRKKCVRVRQISFGLYTIHV